MKKLLLILTSIFVIVALTGCAQAQDTADNAATATTAAPQNQSTTQAQSTANSTQPSQNSTAAAATATTTATATSSSSLPEGCIAYNDAINHVGETATVYGKVVSTHYSSDSKGKPTFLNIGAKYGDSSRCSVVIWQENRDNFSQAPEDHYDQKTVKVTGTITTYDGVAEIEISSPDAISIVD